MRINHGKFTGIHFNKFNYEIYYNWNTLDCPWVIQFYTFDCNRYIDVREGRSLQFGAPKYFSNVAMELYLAANEEDTLHLTRESTRRHLS